MKTKEEILVAHAKLGRITARLYAMAQPSLVPNNPQGLFGEKMDQMLTGMQFLSWSERIMQQAAAHGPSLMWVLGLTKEMTVDAPPEAQLPLPKDGKFCDLDEWIAEVEKQLDEAMVELGANNEPYRAAVEASLKEELEKTRKHDEYYHNLFR